MNLEEIKRRNKAKFYIARSPRGYGLSYFAKEEFHFRDVVCLAYGRIVDHQTAKTSIQFDRDKHIVPSRWGGRFLNHSCDPNIFPQSELNGFPVFIALRKIMRDEEITYAYYTTEFSWESYCLETHCPCMCGSLNCTGRIRAFSQLSHREQMQLVRKRQLSKYLLELVQIMRRGHRHKFILSKI